MSFQGKEVQVRKVRFTGGGQEVFDVPPQIDQIVSVELNGRVTGVRFSVNEQTGDLEQEVSIKVLEVADITVETFPRMVSVNGKIADADTGEVLNG